MQQHRETAETGLREVLAYLVLLRTQKFFGEVTLKFREGVVIGHVHEHRDHLVTGLPQATAEEIEAHIQADSPKSSLDGLAKIGQKQGDMMTAALKRAKAEGKGASSIRNDDFDEYQERSAAFKAGLKRKAEQV